MFGRNVRSLVLDIALASGWMILAETQSSGGQKSFMAVAPRSPGPLGGRASLLSKR